MVVSISEFFSDFTKEGVERDLKKWMQSADDYLKQVEYLVQIQEENSARNYFEKYKSVTEQIDTNKEIYASTQEETKEAEEDFQLAKETFEKSLKDYFSQNIMNEIYQKIDPH